MTDPVFIKSTKLYPTYGDFWRLVELSGFKTAGAREADFQKAQVYIWPTLDHEFMETMDAFPKKERQAKVVFWNLERPDGSYRGRMDIQELFWKGTGELLSWADAVWVSDKGLAGLDDRNVFAVLGGHPGLRLQPETPATQDVVHLGQRTPRRQAIFKKMREDGLSIAEPSWGDEREKALASCRLLLSIDRVHGIHFTSPLRYVLAAAYGLPILSEEIEDPYPLVVGKTVMMSPYDSLANAAQASLRMPLMGSVLPDIGEACRKLLCEEWTFRKGVTEALERTREIS